MNTRQRKLSILREMKALKREYNRLSPARRTLKRKIINEDSPYTYDFGDVNLDYILKYYLQMGQTHAKKQYVYIANTERNTRRLAKDVAESIIENLESIEKNVDNMREATKKAIESYLKGVKNGGGWAYVWFIDDEMRNIL